MFGRDLREVRPAARPGRGPWPLECLLARLRAAGGSCPDLFRRRACPRGVQAVREGLEARGARGAAEFLATVGDPHLVAGAVKLYLASLPEPLLTFELYPAFLSAARVPGTGPDVGALRDLVRGLPGPERDAVRLLTKFLKDMRGATDAETSGDEGGEAVAGRLPEPNLGALFAPLLLRRRDKTWVDVDTRDIHCATAVVGHFIQNVDDLLAGGGGGVGPAREGESVACHGGGHTGTGTGGGESAEAPGVEFGAGAIEDATVARGVWGAVESLFGGQDKFGNVLGGVLASAGLVEGPEPEEQAVPAQRGHDPSDAQAERVPVPSIAISTARVREMTLEASLQEKSLLKRELKGVDERFAQLTGRKPSKEEKEHLKPLYLRYWKLKKHIEKQRHLAHAGTPLAALNV